MKIAKFCATGRRLLAGKHAEISIAERAAYEQFVRDMPPSVAETLYRSTARETLQAALQHYRIPM